LFSVYNCCWLVWADFASSSLSFLGLHLCVSVVLSLSVFYMMSFRWRTSTCVPIKRAPSKYKYRLRSRIRSQMRSLSRSL